MKRSGALLTSAFVCALGVATAHADTFAFSFGTSSDAFSGSGVLTGSLQSSGTYLITGISGTTNTGNGTDRPIASLVAPGDFFDNDNLLLASGSGYQFDVFGLSYQLRNGALINLSRDINGDLEALERVNGKDVSESVPISIAATPEPGSFVLMGTGLLGAVGALRRRFAV